MTPWGLLLINLGTPKAPERGAVRDYLAEFLDDPRVLDMAGWKRWLLLNLVILPRRPAASAEGYKEIWSERGSPLLYHGQDLAAAVRERLGDVPVALAMRYQEPSIRDGLAELRAAGAEHVVAFPLFPQYASSSTGSALEKLYAELGRLNDVPSVSVVPPFYDHPGFVQSFAEVARGAYERADAERVIFSFHGLPERHMKASEVSGAQCLTGEHLKGGGCCAAIGPHNRTCYRAQCFATARALAAALELAPDTWEVTFQSRLGRDPWIQPFTDVRLGELAKAGTKRVLIFSPSFVADCLETLEELGMREREAFKAAGGEELTVAPCVNASPAWADAVAQIARAHSGETS